MFSFIIAYNLKMKIACLNGAYLCCFDRRQINIDFNVVNPWLLSHNMHKHYALCIKVNLHWITENGYKIDIILSRRN